SRHPDRAAFAMAGLWNRLHDGRSNEEIWSCTVIVKDSDDWFGRFHDRMAVLLAPDAYDDWLDPSRKQGQLDLLKTSAFHRDGEFEYFPISTLVNNPGYDAADCVAPASEEELKARARANAQIELGI